MKRFWVWTACLLASGTLLAQNTTSANASDVAWGQKVISSVNGPGASQLWYRNEAIIGRSYCVETGAVESGSLATQNPDTEIFEYRSDANTVLVNNNDAPDDPRNGVFSRACWIHPAGANSTVYTKVIPHTGTVPASAITVRWVETTLYCPWFFVAGDYNAFSLIRNTTGQAQNGVVVTWRGLNGLIAGSTTVSIPANGTLIINARDFVDTNVIANGSIEIAHTGSPEALIGSTTTLSGTSGLGFDAQFEQRKAW
jgi:hypothetical protein